MCVFFLEFLSKISVADELDGFENDHHDGLFNVLSNALFFLNEAVKQKNFKSHNHLFIFLAKLSVQLGITLDVEHCLFCGEALNSEMCLFDPQNGGFSCHDCSSKKDEFLSNNKLLLSEYQSSTMLKNLFEQIYKMPYKNYPTLPDIAQGLTIAQFNYINLQFGFSKEQFKSWSMISAF